MGIQEVEAGKGIHVAVVADVEVLVGQLLDHAADWAKAVDAVAREGVAGDGRVAMEVHRKDCSIGNHSEDEEGIHRADNRMVQAG